MRKLSHSAKPKVKFLGGPAPWYVGMELEMEAPTSEAHIAGLGVVKCPKYYYAKHDGSLRNGWELVTHPINPACWLDRANKHVTDGPVGRTVFLVEALKKLGYTSYDNGRCGLHVHVSRTAFEDPTTRYGSGGKTLRTCRFYWFSRLINGPLFCRLSQRCGDRLNQWAKQEPVSTRTFHQRKSNRYVAVNITGTTVEVRIFRGNMRIERIRKCVEAVIAAVEFAATRTSRDRRDDLDTDFRVWVSENRTRFPNLHAYLISMTRDAAPVAQEEAAV